MTSRASPRTASHAGKEASRALRLVTATSLFDGHDAAINIIRRLIQDHGSEVVHLGHNRSVEEIVTAALQEDVDGIAVSSYQGGHMEFFRYLVDALANKGASYIRVFGGGGGTITSAEAAELESIGVEKIYSPDEGLEMGLDGMITDLIQRTKQSHENRQRVLSAEPLDHRNIGQMLSVIEQGSDVLYEARSSVRDLRASICSCRIVGVTGTGGAGKSTVIDELLMRLRRSFTDLRIALLAIDPTRHRSGGALLGDRIRMNSVSDGGVFMRSMATRRRHRATNEMLMQCIDYLKSAGFGLVIVETAGIGQSESEIVDLSDVSIYVMTSDYGAAGQLEKIEMLDYADLVILNKFDKRGAEDALRDVRRQWRRNHKAFHIPDEAVPVYPTIASRYHDPGMERAFAALCTRLANMSRANYWTGWEPVPMAAVTNHVIVPSARVRYLAEISEHGRVQSQRIKREAALASQARAYYESLKALNDAALPGPLEHYNEHSHPSEVASAVEELREKYEQSLAGLSDESLQLLRSWHENRASHSAEQYSYNVRGQEVRGTRSVESLSHLQIPKVALPAFEDWGELLQFLLKENLPGTYPYTAGVYPYRRATEQPTRMFAGEGTPERTNRRFHYLIKGQSSVRLSTAFDPIVLYGEDPQARPDVYGRIGMSGESVATVDDVKRLYSGIDLCKPNTSVSMTINGPAPSILAMFLNAAIDQQVEKYLRGIGTWAAVSRRFWAVRDESSRPHYRGDLPEGHDQLGLGLLGVSGQQVVDREVYEKIKADAFGSIRGTLQADILKEDQAQNECIFATEFALKMMGDVQAYFIDHGIRNFYSVSVSGYHIAEAGANPVTQLAFTLANGFTLVEYYLSRGMQIDDFAPQMSFFFSNGMDPEYAVIGRVARRIWARAMRDIYQASPRSQMLKYHVQTSGRSLHAEEIAFNDIRTTLQALYATLDNCNSLHTNAYDEAVTTPTEESVRRALAIQMIINEELGLNYNQNPLQGSFAVEQLTDQVEEAVYREFDRLTERGGVLGAMETQYQRSKIQEESLYYEQQKHDGSLPIVGVNMFKSPHRTAVSDAKLIRSSDEEKDAQIRAVEESKRYHAAKSPAALQRLKDVAQREENIFTELMDTVRYCSLGQITHALYDVGGQYRRRI